MRAEISVTGIVQGVGFRPFIYREAMASQLKGYVRNRGDAGVEIVVEGDECNVNNLLRALKEGKPPLARIYGVTVTYGTDTQEFHDFKILKSSERRTAKGSVIPQDVAICDECVEELRDPRNPRHNYFFITCTNCGPRFTTIQKLPYDRNNTTMKEFSVCDFCRREFMNPSNRRFHAQTIACSKCGPHAYLTTNEGKFVAEKHPIWEAGRLLEEGHVLAVKGYGGFHLATATTKDKPIMRLRQVKHRAQKPFAIMTRDLQTIRTFAKASIQEENILSSPSRPIVLLDKAEDYYLSDFVAPRLHNVGTMLPYTALHMMLFDKVEEPAFVMTSANPTDEPIVADDTVALKKLSSTVDFFLFHNRSIVQRCDDSVIRSHHGRPVYIRRSRGYAPTPLTINDSSSKSILALGAEENVTSCILHRDKAFISQHIGDVKKLETFGFLKETISHLMMLTGVDKFDCVSCDMHPNFATTKLAQDLSAETDSLIHYVQHHHAHILSLMGEQVLEETIGIACDGFGYGEDGNAWGGEILRCSLHEFNRLGHLEEQPMIGGDLVARYPLRMAIGILNQKANIDDWIFEKSKHFPHGRSEAEAIIAELDKKSVATTTSCGRLLDAISAVLGICLERTYQGEPAVKLESAATGGHDILKLEPEITGHTLLTSGMVHAIFEARNKESTADLAYSAQSYVAKGLAQLAVEAALDTGIEVIGFSGGVAHNAQISSIIGKEISRHGIDFLVHKNLPPGDGGLSFGQAIAAANS